jgi:hypothetical protein
MTAEELVTFCELSGGRSPPKKRVSELVVISGRRCGKDSVASLLAVFAASIEQNHIGRLRPGEKAFVYCIAADRDQARVVKDYIGAYFAKIDDLRRMVVRETRLGVELNNGVAITIATNSFRATRGRTLLLAILDEVAFYRDETSANPDVELYRALTPSLSTLPGSMMVLISSPYKRSGLLYDRWKASFGKDDDRRLVIQSSSLGLNPLVDQEEIAARREEDPQAARAEWDGQFRDDVASYVSIEIVEAAVTAGCVVRPPVKGTHYFGFCDPSGGVSDAMTLAISHREGDRLILDLMLERRPPFSPADVVREFCATLKGYRILKVVGDRYGSEWVSSAFAKEGVGYEPAEQVKSDLYLSFLPSLNSGVVDLIDDKRLVAQLCQPERRTARGGKDTIDHPKGLHDDVSNAAAGALVLAAKGRAPMRVTTEAVRTMAGLPPLAPPSQGPSSAPAPQRNPMMVRGFDYSGRAR